MQNSCFQFSTPYLVNLIFETNQSFITTSNTAIDIPLSFSINIRKNDEIKEAIVDLIVNIGTKDKSSPFYIEATESALFRWTEYDDSFSHILLEQNAPALLLSYLRPIICNLTASSNYAAYNIPFVDFTKPVSKKE